MGKGIGVGAGESKVTMGKDVVTVETPGAAVGAYNVESSWAKGRDDAAAGAVVILQQRIVRLERELKRLAAVVEKRHPIGQVKGVGLLEAVDGALDIMGTRQQEKARDAAVKVCQQLRLDIVNVGGVTSLTVKRHDTWMRLMGKACYDAPNAKTKRRSRRR